MLAAVERNIGPGMDGEIGAGPGGTTVAGLIGLIATIPPPEQPTSIASGASLLWRIKKDRLLPCEKRLPVGSSLSRIYASQTDQRLGDHDPRPRTGAGHRTGGSPSRALKIETAFDELKTYLRGACILLCSKVPDLVRQEFYGLLLAPFGVRSFIQPAQSAPGAR